MSHRIHIVCTKPEMCVLIKKALAANDYIISCCSGETINENSITGFRENVDCLILDRNINSEITKKAKEIFNNSDILYLPTLEPTESTMDNLNISAPLRLSELSERLENLFKVSSR